MDLAVEDGVVLTPEGVVEADVGVDDGEIRTIGAVEDADRTLDAEGCVVTPGLVNSHTHAAMTLFRGYADDMPLETWLEDEIWPIEALLDGDSIEVGSRLAAVEMIETGTTCFADMYFEMDRVAEVVESSGLKALLGYGAITVGKDEEEAEEELEACVEFARRNHDTAEGRVRTMITPHAPYTCSSETLERAAEAAVEEDLVLHTHLSETEEEVEDSVEMHGETPGWRLEEHGFYNADAYVAHGVHLDGSELELLAREDVGVAHCPSANAKLAAGVAPVAEAVEAGVDVCIGTDGPASNNDLDMWEEARMAALLAKARDLDASAVPAYDALEMATAKGADALGFDSGRLEEGRAADLAVVDLDSSHLTPRHDVVSHLVYSANGADVRHTVVDGEVLMEDDEVLSLDADAVLEEAEETAGELAKEAEG